MVTLPRARLSAGVTCLILSLLVSCAPPKEVDYAEPDAGPDPNAPVPVAVDPAEGDEGVNRYKVFRITFDQHLNSRSLRQGRITLRSGEAASRWLVSYYNPVHKHLVTWPAGPMLPECTWVLSLERGIEGLNGASVYPVELAWFRTGKEATVETPFKIRSFDGEVAPIFDTHCVTCHGGIGEAIAGLKLDNAENIKETALNEPAAGWPDWTLIEPTRPGQSYLLYKVVGDENLPGQTMPRSLGDETPTSLTTEEKEIIAEWIAGGAAFFDQ